MFLELHLSERNSGADPMFKGAMIAMTAILTTLTPAKAGKLGVYQSDAKGFDTRTYWYDDGREVTVFDTQFVPALTEAMVAEIRKSTTNPISRVVVTHPNPDKFNGLSVMHKIGATSIASKATADAMQGVHDYKKYFWVEIAKAFTQENYPKLEPVKQTFEGEQIIKLASGETITLIQLKHAGVASTQTVARIDATGDLIVGDLIHHNAHAWLEGGIVGGAPKVDIAAWIAAVDELPSLGGKIVRGGRGDDAPVDTAVAEQKAYLKAIDALVAQYVKDLGARSSELKDAEKAGGHHKAIQTKAETVFPSLKLSYLIGYGVYGLANSKL
jgi:glyoxylase-like metal-dependent hydrolase (beta-lactamase superfamily II)